MSPHLSIDCSHRRLVKRLIKTVDGHYTQDSMSLYIIRRRKLSNNASTPSSELEGVYVGRGVACHVPQWRDSPREVDSAPAVDLHISFTYLSSFAVQRCRQPGWTLHFAAEQCRFVNFCELFPSVLRFFFLAKSHTPSWPFQTTIMLAAC